MKYLTVYFDMKGTIYSLVETKFYKLRRKEHKRNEESYIFKESL